MPFTSVAGARIYWKLEGSEGASPLILLNSIGTDMDLWEPLLPALRQHFLLLRIDTRGHGASPAEPGDFAMALLARDVLAVAHDAGIGRFAVAGVSLGGMIAMELALRRPEQVRALALVCTSATMDAGSWDDRIAKVRGQGMAAIVDLAMGRFLSAQTQEGDPALYETIARGLLSMDPQGYAGCGAAIRDMDLAGRISAIRCPTLIVTGTRDSSTPFEGHGEQLLARIPGASHLAIAAAHLAPLEAPDALAAALIPFLEC